MLESGAKFAEAALVLTAHREGRTPSVSDRRIGPALIFGRLWDELQLPQVIERLLAGRRFDLPLERILVLTVLHRLFDPGSDRSCLQVWKKGYEIPGTKDVFEEPLFARRRDLFSHLDLVFFDTTSIDFETESTSPLRGRSSRSTKRT